MLPEAHIEAAKRLHRAEAERRQIGCLSRAHPGMDMRDAYAIQAAWVALKRAAGRRIIGHKIGLTSRAMQQQLGIDIPDSGILFDDMLFDDGATVPAGRFIAPRVEAEIAFVMAGALQGPGVTAADVLAATGAVAPALEILDTRIHRIDPETGARRTVLDTIADNAANAGLVLGAVRHPPGAFDLPRVGVALLRDGAVEETGLGAGVLGDPLRSMAWLANRLAEHGDRITPGEVVLSGSFIRAVEAPPGSRFEADFGPFGRVSVAFGKGDPQ